MSITTTKVTTQKMRIFCVLLKSPVFTNGLLTCPDDGDLPEGGCTLFGPGTIAGREGVTAGINGFGGTCWGVEERTINCAGPFIGACVPLRAGEGIWDGEGTAGVLAVPIKCLRSSMDDCGLNGV